MGKTTLLNHIAERKLAIPPRIDVLLCEQEVVADDTPAIDAVLKADTKRLELLAEERKLMAEAEAGDDSNSDRLKEVCVCVCVWGLRNHKEIMKIRMVMVLINCSHGQRSPSFTGAKITRIFQYSMAYVSLPQSN